MGDRPVGLIVALSVALLAGILVVSTWVMICCCQRRITIRARQRQGLDDKTPIGGAEGPDTNVV